MVACPRFTSLDEYRHSCTPLTPHHTLSTPARGLSDSKIAVVLSFDAHHIWYPPETASAWRLPELLIDFVVVLPRRNPCHSYTPWWPLGESSHTPFQIILPCSISRAVYVGKPNLTDRTTPASQTRPLPVNSPRTHSTNPSRCTPPSPTHLIP